MSEHKRARLSLVLEEDCLGEILSFLTFRELLRYQLVHTEWKTLIRSLIPRIPYLDLSNIEGTSSKSIRDYLFPLLDIDGDGLFKHFQSPRVNLSGITLSDDMCRTLLQNNAHLRELNLNSCSSVKTLDYILPQLTYLNISNTYIRPPENNLQLPNLKTIVGRDNNAFSIGAMAPNLETLHARDLNYHFGQLFVSLALTNNAFQKLKYINFDITKRVAVSTLQPIYDIVGNLPCLEKMSVLHSGPLQAPIITHTLAEYYDYHKLGQYSSNELQKMFGRYFSINDFGWLPREMVHVTHQQVQDYEINLNLFAREHGNEWMRNAKTVQAILDMGISLSILYYYDTFERKVESNPCVLPVVLDCPRACSRFNFKSNIHNAISQDFENKEQVIRMLHERYTYDTRNVLDMLYKLNLRSRHLETFKLLEELFPQVSTLMPTLDCLPVLQNASTDTVEYILQKGYANDYVKHVPNFVWLPETYTKEKSYLESIGYLFPKRYRNGKAVDPDTKQMHRSSTITGGKPKSFKDAMTNIGVVTKSTNNTRLHHVTDNYHASPHLIAVLINCGVPINATNKKGETALRLSLDHRDGSSVRCLLFHNATLDIPSTETIICRIKDLTKLSNAIQIQMQLEHTESVKKNILFMYDDHDGSDTYLLVLQDAGAKFVQIEKNDRPTTEERAMKQLARLKLV